MTVCTSCNMSSLTAEQKQRIEENRRKALALRANRVRQQEAGNAVASLPTKPPALAHGNNRKSCTWRNLQNTASKTMSVFNTPKDAGTFSRKPTTTLLTGDAKLQATFLNKSTPTSQPLQNSATKDTDFRPKTSTGPGLTIPEFSSAPSRSSNAKPYRYLKRTPANPVCGSTPQNATLKGKCVLLSRHRFCVDVGYHAALIVLFKSMPTKQYGK